jgi:DnaK suppressor protein
LQATLLIHQKKDLEFYRQQLIELRRELTTADPIGLEAAQPVELDQARTGRLTRMDAMQAQAISVASKNRRQAKLRQVAAALERIERGDYGRCIECDTAIVPARLEFDPTVVFCVACAAQAEA